MAQWTDAVAAAHHGRHNPAHFAHQDAPVRGRTRLDRGAAKDKTTVEKKNKGFSILASEQVRVVVLSMDRFFFSLSLSLSVFHDQSAVPNGGQKFVFSSPFFFGPRERAHGYQKMSVTKEKKTN